MEFIFGPHVQGLQIPAVQIKTHVIFNWQSWPPKFGLLRARNVLENTSQIKGTGGRNYVPLDEEPKRSYSSGCGLHVYKYITAFTLIRPSLD